MVIPFTELDPETAKSKGYILKTDEKASLDLLKKNESMVKFSTQNINRPDLMNVLGLRLEGLLIRLRYVIYSVLIVSMVNFPLACSFLILIFETLYLLTYTSYTLRYNYAKNWLVIASKFNVGVIIIGIALVALHLNVQYEDVMYFSNRVNPQLQLTIMVALLFGVAMEIVIIGISIGQVVYRTVLKCTGKGKKKE